MIRSANINVMISAVRKAAPRLVRDFGEIEQLQVSRKGPSDFVTVADQRTDRILREELGKARPDFGFRTEEGADAAARDGEHVWVVDPLDGTTNFLHGLPHFAISVGLERAGEPIAGVVYDPVKDEMFVAEKGQGAFLNDRRIRVSGRDRMEDALLATGLPFHGTQGQDRTLRELELLMGRVAGIRRFGAAALDLAYVAAGRYEGYWECGIKAWDICAGIVLVREAGGIVTDPHGDGDPLKSGCILAATSALHGTVQDAIRQAARAPVRGP